MTRLKARYRVDFFGISDVGLVRTQNEDAWYVAPDAALYLLADGMGGHNAGEVAANLAVEFLVDYVKRKPPPEGKQIDYFKEAISATNRHLYEKGEANSNLRGMGTTLCMVHFQNSHACIAHVGDSRIYRFQNKKLEQLTEDHNLAQELATLGTLSNEPAQLSSFKNVLTRAVGTNATVKPTLQEVECHLGDLFLLCSDGLSNYVKDSQIKDIILQSTSLEQRGQRLVELAKEQGGGDNITLVLMQLEA